MQEEKVRLPTTSFLAAAIPLMLATPILATLVLATMSAQAQAADLAAYLKQFGPDGGKAQ